MKKYHKENCSSTVRATIKDKWGRRITLFGTHAFEWEIAIESCGKMTIRQYPNGQIAREEFKKLKRKR